MTFVDAVSKDNFPVLTIKFLPSKVRGKKNLTVLFFQVYISLKELFI